MQDQERQYRALLSFDATSWAKDIKSPTFVIASSEDIIALPSESENLVNSIKGAKLIFISGGHASPTEVPLEVHQAILDVIGTSD